MKRFVLFVGVGGISTLIQFLLLILFVESRLLSEVIASAVGYALSSLFNYWANYHYTFKSHNNHTKTFPKYALAAPIGLSANTLFFSAFLWLFNNYLTLHWVEHYLAAQFLATGITLVLNFAIHKFWIYRNH